MRGDRGSDTLEKGRGKEKKIERKFKFLGPNYAVDREFSY
jgi:hypothetical protein